MATLKIRTTATVTINIDDTPKMIASKKVRDDYGDWTDYTWYLLPDGTHQFVFEDMDDYDPDYSPIDWECDSWKEAGEWFSCYKSSYDEAMEEAMDESIQEEIEYWLDGISVK